jgi:hypothetical protein
MVYEGSHRSRSHGVEGGVEQGRDAGTREFDALGTTLAALHLLHALEIRFGDQLVSDADGGVVGENNAW